VHEGCVTDKMIKEYEMSKLLLVVLVSFGLVANVHADETQEQDNDVRTLHHKNFSSQRPYSKAPVAKQQSPEDKWEGAGIVTDKPDKGFGKHDQLRLNFIGRRPYVADTPRD
jgi:hypothetical protein